MQRVHRQAKTRLLTFLPHYRLMAFVAIALAMMLAITVKAVSLGGLPGRLRISCTDHADL